MLTENNSVVRDQRSGETSPIMPEGLPVNVAGKTGVLWRTFSEKSGKFSKKQRQKIILNAIETLPPKQKEVIVLFDMYGLSYEQIAQKINCPQGTVKSRIYNARKQLAEDLKDLL